MLESADSKVETVSTLQLTQNRFDFGIGRFQSRNVFGMIPKSSKIENKNVSTLESTDSKVETASTLELTQKHVDVGTDRFQSRNV